MSDSDDQLQSRFDEFSSKHGHNPTASQLSKFAGCKYSEASRFLRNVKSSSKPSPSKSISSPKQKIEQTEKPKPRLYTSAPISTKKPKKRACKKYQLDMTAQTFGSCKCGFSKQSHYDNSSWSDSDTNDDKSEEEQDISDQNEPQPVQCEQKVKIENNNQVKQEQDNDQNESQNSQNTSTKSPSKSISSSQPTIDKTEKTKLTSYSASISTKKTKKRACKKYQLDMTAQTFGSCKCGFSKQSHFDNSSWSDDDSDDDIQDDNSSSDQQQSSEQPVQYEQKVKVKVENDNQNKEEHKKQDTDQNEIRRLQNTIKTLQEQLISKQQEINKSYQEKEGLKKTISEQRAQINKLKKENEILKQKQNSVNNTQKNKERRTDTLKLHKQPAVVKKPKEKKREVSMNRSVSAHESVVSHATTEKKFLCYAIQKLGDENDSGGFEITFGVLFTDILFEQIFEGLPGTLFGSKNKKMVTYASPMLMYPSSKDVMIELFSKKLVNSDDVKQLLIEYIEKHTQQHRKDNLLFLLDAMHESKESYGKACKCFEKYSISQQRR